MAERPGQEDAPISQAGEARSARVESLRAVAALLVLSGHVFGAAHGYRAQEIYGSFRSRALLGGGLGVFLFFTLSGYLLYLPFARRDFGEGHAVDLRRYARNRALRILPLYYVVVVVVLLVQERGGTAEQWWRFLLFAENFSHRTVGRVNGPMWSLVVELHFYVILPLLALGLAGVARRSKLLAATVLVGLGALSMLVRQVTLADGQVWQYSLPVTFYFFASGMVLALGKVWWERSERSWQGAVERTGAWLAPAAAVGVWLVVVRGVAGSGAYSLLPVLSGATFLTVAACVVPRAASGPVKILEWRPLALVGLASYSLYMWHFPIVEGLARLSWVPSGYLGLLSVTVPASLVAAFVSYALVEAPFLRLRRRWSKSLPAPAPAPVPPPGAPAVPAP